MNAKHSDLKYNLAPFADKKGNIVHAELWGVGVRVQYKGTKRSKRGEKYIGIKNKFVTPEYFEAHYFNL